MILIGAVNMNDDYKRVNIFFENHIGIGIRWSIDWMYQFELSISIPFITATIGFGRRIG